MNRASLRVAVSSKTVPVLVNEGFVQHSATKVNDPLFAT
jgi:hypothetical protein